VHDSIAVVQPLARKVVQQCEKLPLVRNAIELLLQGQRIAARLRLHRARQCRNSGARFSVAPRLRQFGLTRFGLTRCADVH
jgi:hypothetical protein